jgi:hypothetical protein
MGIFNEEVKMKRELSRNGVKKGLPLIFLLLFALCYIGCVTYKPSTLVVKRSGTLLDDGKLYVYVDGKQINKNQPIGKGQTRSLPVSNGFHRVRVTVNSLESDEMRFMIENGTVSFNASTERVGGSKILVLERSTD